MVSILNRLGFLDYLSLWNICWAFYLGASLLPCYLFGNTQLYSLWCGGDNGTNYRLKTEQCCWYNLCRTVIIIIFVCIYGWMDGWMKIVYVCMYLLMYVCMIVCKYVCKNVCMYACMHVCMIVCKYKCKYVYACMYDCMY